MTAGDTIDPSRALPLLTPQQRRFCEAYVANGRNGTQAAIAAGYGQKSAHVRASKLLTLPKVQQALAELVIPAAAKAIADMGKKGAEIESRELAVTAREEAVAAEESIDAMRERIKLRIVNALCGMAFTRMDDLATWGTNGVEFTPSDELTPEALEAIETIESESRELELKEGTRLAVDVKLKVKRHNRIAAMKELRSLLEIGPAPGQRGPDARTAPAGPSVLVVVAGGPTGLEMGAHVTARVLSPGDAPEAIATVPPGATVVIGRPPSSDVPRETSAPTSPPKQELRAWNPKPRKPVLVAGVTAPRSRKP